MSTLEAVASALVLLEPGDSGRRVRDALLHAFKGMVSIQEQHQMRGRAAKLEQYGGVSKQDAVEAKAKRLELQRRQTKSAEAATTDKDKNENEDASRLMQRAYVLYTSHTDFRHRQQLTQQV